MKFNRMTFLELKIHALELSLSFKPFFFYFNVKIRLVVFDVKCKGCCKATFVQFGFIYYP